MVGYETTYILKSDVSDDQAKVLLEKIKGIIQQHQGEVQVVEDWGRRRFAYPIKKETRGLYTYILYSGNNSLVAEIERNLRIAENVLRFLTVKLMDDFDASKMKRKSTPNVAPTVNMAQQ